MSVVAPPVAATISAPVTAAPAVAATAINTPKIKNFTLCDFRAFAGPEPVTFKLDGKNLLIYGENGAGKSSVFHGLDEFFSAAQPNAQARKKRLAELENIFPNRGKGNVFFEVTFEGDATPVRWDGRGHPADTGGYPAKSADSRVVNAAFRKAMLDYRSLLNTNYQHGNGEVNLFTVIIDVLLRDYPVAHDGKESRLTTVWELLSGLPKIRKGWDYNLTRMSALCSGINAALDEALTNLVPRANVILAKLGWDDVSLERFEMSGLSPHWAHQIRDRKIAGQRLVPILNFNGVALDRPPQTFLNEARLSALALAIYFAGRQICAATLQADTPRLIVLDDVLIGLDQSNRLPVLDLLADDFKDWQVVLLTHDRVWFEMARAYHRRHKADQYWRYAKIHSNDDHLHAPSVTAVDSSAASEALADGRNFLKNGHVNAAGNYARIAAELALREFCEVKKVEVAYQQLPDKTPASDLLKAVKAFSKKASGAYDAPLGAIEMYTGILFNKLSHGGVPSVTQHEIKGAFNAVDTLLFALKVVPTGAKQNSP